MNSLNQQALKELERHGFQRREFHYGYDKDHDNLCVWLSPSEKASYMETPLAIYVPEKDLCSQLLFATERDQINRLCDEWGFECAETWSKGGKTERYETMARRTSVCIADFKEKLMDLHEELRRLQTLTGERAA